MRQGQRQSALPADMRQARALIGKWRRNGRGTAIKLLFYDGQGFWLAHKRLSKGKFPCWRSDGGRNATALQAHQLQVLLFAGDPYATRAAPMWRRVNAPV